MSSAIAALIVATDALRHRVAELERMSGDLPANYDTVVVDLVRDACDDMDGWLAALNAAATTAQATGRRRSPPAIAAALAECTSASEQALRSYVTSLGGVDSLSRLRQLALDRPGSPWQVWAWEIQHGIAAVWPALTTARSALDRCWQELVEHLLTDPVEVQALPTPRTHLVTDALVGGQ